ncbi:Amino acid transporter, transmembrane domain [Sesbania bispinosa]|nr:Amino acid transporter, transmembrane domain [Sesbania bispinosa]
MLSQKQAEEAIVTNPMRQSMKLAQGKKIVAKTVRVQCQELLMAWWFCMGCMVSAVLQIKLAQVLLTLPYSFSQLVSSTWSIVPERKRKMLASRTMSFSGLKSLMGYLVHIESSGASLQLYFSSLWICDSADSMCKVRTLLVTFYYINDNWTNELGPIFWSLLCYNCVIPSFHNYRIWSFLGLGMTTYTAWYLCIAAITHGQIENVVHTGPKKLVLYFTGATNILYTLVDMLLLCRYCLSPNCTREIMHAMWKPQKFKYIYLVGHFVRFHITIPSPVAVYWAFGDELLNHANAFSLLPRVASVMPPLSSCSFTRLPVVIPIWFLAIIFPFFGPINSAVGALLVSFTVYIIPALAHMLTYRKASARKNAAEQPPLFLRNWTAVYVFNAFIVIWIFVIGFGFGGWASMTNFIKQIDTFGLFAKCYQCKPPTPPAAAAAPPPHPHHQSRGAYSLIST